MIIINNDNIFKNLSGLKLSLSEYIDSNKEELIRYLSVLDIEDVLDEIITLAVEGNSTGEFLVEVEDVYSDSYGDGPSAEYFFVKRVLVVNKRLNVIFYLNYSGYFDRYGELDYSDVEGETYVYELSPENEKLITN